MPCQIASNEVKEKVFNDITIVKRRWCKRRTIASPESRLARLRRAMSDGGAGSVKLDLRIDGAARTDGAGGGVFDDGRALRRDERWE